MIKDKPWHPAPRAAVVENTKMSCQDVLEIILIRWNWLSVQPRLVVIGTELRR